jgi:predicted MFS family arabinose efflux permease
MPMGISQGFVTVTLPFLLTKSGFPVALTAGIVAIGLSANLWRFAWGPVVDLSLSLHKWYWLSLLACIAGTGIGGGACLWLATHYNLILAGIALCAASIFFAMVMLLTQDIPYLKEKTIAHEVKGMSRDILAMIKSPVALFAMVLIIMPIGTGAMANLWSAVAEDWKTDADTVVLVTGLLCGGVSAVGCIAGGFIADRWGVWNAYLGIGIICALVTFLIALLPYLPATYISGVLVYGFCTGLIYAAYTAVILFVIGKKHTATKFSLMSSLGNLPVVYMTTFNGWTHDKFGSRYMLIAEAIAGIIFVIISFVALQQMKQKNMIPVIVE